jgi:hypothetical protein
VRSRDGFELSLRFVDFESRVADVTEPPLRILVQTPPQQLSNPRRRVRRQRAPLWLAFKHRRNRLGERIAEECGATRARVNS